MDEYVQSSSCGIGFICGGVLYLDHSDARTQWQQVANDGLMAQHSIIVRLFIDIRDFDFDMTKVTAMTIAIVSDPSKIGSSFNTDLGEAERAKNAIKTQLNHHIAQFCTALENACSHSDAVLLHHLRAAVAITFFDEK